MVIGWLPATTVFTNGWKPQARPSPYHLLSLLPHHHHIATATLHESLYIAKESKDTSFANPPQLLKLLRTQAARPTYI